MLHVVGGSYREICHESQWDELFGSGLRAAVAVSHVCEQVKLSTYISERDRGTLEAYTSTFGIAAAPSLAKHTIGFTYSHGLGRPWIDPPLHLITPESILEIEAASIIRFGMLEGDALVQGDWVVYDPQSAYSPRPFHENGSTAEHLAIVANHHEGYALTGQKDSLAIGRALLGEHNAEVALLKQGASGVQVFYGDKSLNVPAFRTERVFPIGSGDVFAAVFAFHWAELRRAPEEAAMAASLSTAFYCATRRLPVPEDPMGTGCVGPSIEPVRGGRFPRRVYIASPFFTTADRWLVEEARHALRKQGLEVFSPYHDVGMGEAAEVVPKDLEALTDSDAVLAIGDRLDAGTLFEIGYARCRGIPVVAFIQNEPHEPLKMLVGTDCEIVDEFVSAIYRSSWAAIEA